MAKRKKKEKPAGKVEEVNGDFRFTGPKRGLIEPHRHWHSNLHRKSYQVDGKELEIEYYNMHFPDDAFEIWYVRDRAAKAALEIVTRFVGKNDPAEIDKAFMLTGVHDPFLSDAEKEERQIPRDVQVPRVISDWQRKLRAALSDVEIDLLLDAFELIAELKNWYRSEEEYYTLLRENPGLKYNRDVYVIFNQAFKIGCLYERIKTARPAEKIAGSGLASHAGGEKGRNKQKKTRREQWAEWQTEVDELRGYRADGPWKQKMSHNSALLLAAEKLNKSYDTLRKRVVNRRPRQKKK